MSISSQYQMQHEILIYKIMGVVIMIFHGVSKWQILLKYQSNNKISKIMWILMCFVGVNSLFVIVQIQLDARITRA